MAESRLRPGLLVLSDVRRTWPQQLFVSIAMRAGVAAVLLPAIALLLRVFMLGKGRSVLSNQVMDLGTEIGVFTMPQSDFDEEDT